MENIVSDPRVVPGDRRTLKRAPIKPCRSHALWVGTAKLPSSSLRPPHARGVYLHAYLPLIAKQDVFCRNLFVRPLVRLISLPAKILYTRGNTHSYLCYPYHVFLALKQRQGRYRALALWVIYLLNTTVYRPICWSAIESEGVIIPVRDLSKRRDSISEVVPSRKFDRMVHYESLIARGCISIFKHDPRVQIYEEPCTIHCRSDGSERRYPPYLSVTWSDREPVAHVGDPENSLKWTAARLWRTRHNDEIVLMTDAILGTCGAILSNIELLAVCGYQRFPHPAGECLLKMSLSMNGQFTPNDPCEEPRSSNRPVLDQTSGIYCMSAISRRTGPSHYILKLPSYAGKEHSMSRPSPLYRIEIDATELDLLAMDKQGRSLDARVEIVYIRDPATGFISGFSIGEEAATNEQDASLASQNLNHPLLPEI